MVENGYLIKAMYFLVFILVLRKKALLKSITKKYIWLLKKKVLTPL